MPVNRPYTNPLFMRLGAPQNSNKYPECEPYIEGMTTSTGEFAVRGTCKTEKRSHEIIVRVDRVQVVCKPIQGGRKLPAVDGYKVVRDIRVPCQTTAKTYARSRELASTFSNTRLFWQYQPLNGWLEPWKLTFVPDDHGTTRMTNSVTRFCTFTSGTKPREVFTRLASSSAKEN